MSDRSEFWYRLGYALETARHGRARATLDALQGAKVTSSRKDGPRRRLQPGAEEEGAKTKGDGDTGALDLLLAVGTGTAVGRLLEIWPARDRPTLPRLLRAAAAGAAATFLRELLEPLIRGEPGVPALDEELGRRLTAGVARGLVYGGVLEPRLPGPAAARGAVYGTAEYLLSPWGGLRGVLGKHTPYKRLPVVSTLLDDPEAGEEAFLDHLVFGIALGLLYGTDGETRIGIGDADV